MPVKLGDKIKIEYEGTLNDGIVFDSTDKHGFPLKFTVGNGQFLDGFENAVLGMEIGEEKTINLSPAEAYGEYNPDLIKVVRRDNIPTDKDLIVDMLLILNTPDGKQYPAKIIHIIEDKITLDLNHPLAGIALNFKIKLLAIND
ncbi:MAG: peptidylprolyl isomerase [Candidatus Hodarchaeota archaeon]